MIFIPNNLVFAIVQLLLIAGIGFLAYKKKYQTALILSVMLAILFMLQQQAMPR